VRRHAYAYATVAGFRAYAQKVAHRDLSHVFSEWLDKDGKPTW
jgi:aminopeptidase N